MPGWGLGAIHGSRTHWGTWKVPAVEGTTVVSTGLSLHLNNHYIPKVTHMRSLNQPKFHWSLATHPVSGIFQIKLVLLTFVGREVSCSVFDYELSPDYNRRMVPSSSIEIEHGANDESAELKTKIQSHIRTVVSDRTPQTGATQRKFTSHSLEAGSPQARHRGAGSSEASPLACGRPAAFSRVRTGPVLCVNLERALCCLLFFLYSPVRLGPHPRLYRT